MWLYLSYSRMSLIAFAFQLIDSDGNGVVDDEETAQFVRDLAASGLGRDRAVNWHQLTFDLEAARNASESAMTGAQRAAKKRAKEVSEPIFARYALKNPSILYAALHVQEVLREVVCGKAYWLAATERRAGRGEVVQVQEFYDAIKLDVRQHKQLQAIVGMMDGLVVAADLAPNGDVERIRDVWSKTYGVGKRSLMLSRGESMKALNDARGGRPPPDKRSVAGLARALSNKVLAVGSLVAGGAEAKARRAAGGGGGGGSKVAPTR